MHWFLCLMLNAQDLSTFKGQEFAVDVYAFCDAERRTHCTHDADTPKVRVQARGVNGEFSIRLRGVDAPELNQPRGVNAMMFLFGLLGWKASMASVPARVYVEGRDKYGRTLGVIYSESGADINALLVANGYAWVDRGAMPKARRRQLEAAQATARERRLGLWADSNPIEPRDWRRGKR